MIITITFRCLIMELICGMARGCKIGSRLANYYPDRFIGFGFLAVGYLPPNTEQTYEQLVDLVSRHLS